MTKDEWKARLGPSLSESLTQVSDQIMQTEPVQSWLQQASRTATENLRPQSGMQGEMQGYMRMMNDLDDQLPTLVEAVDELTDGLGHVELDWRPFQPTTSRLYIDFDWDYTIHVFYRLDECTEDAAREAVHAIAQALPEGEPFPNRPNTVTGAVSHEGHGLAVRVHEHRTDSGRTRSVTLLLPNQSPIENLSETEVPRHLHQHLCLEES